MLIFVGACLQAMAVPKAARAGIACKQAPTVGGQIARWFGSKTYCGTQLAAVGGGTPKSNFIFVPVSSRTIFAV